MIDRTIKLRWRRRFRHSKRQVEDFGLQAEEQLERHFFRRIARLTNVRRFIAGWVFLVVLLITGLIIQTANLSSYYQVEKPIAGGTFKEGILGAFTDANPLYATGDVDASVSRLVFSSLLKNDEKNHLVGDLADSWKVDERASQYTVHLRNNLYWHDGKKLTANDVVFTYKTIQNPDTKSPLFSSWQGIKVTAVDSRTVVFTLPNSLSSFPYSLVNGIVPEHILGNVPVSQLRSVRFNTTNPIGSGPFTFDRLEVSGDTPETREEVIGLKAYPNYYAGSPKLDAFIIKSFHNDKQMLASFQKDQLDAMVGLSVVPDSLASQNGVNVYNIPISGGVYVFFKTSTDILKDVHVRQALIQAADTGDIVKGLGYSVILANEPLLRGQIGYDYSRAQLTKNIAAANKLLDDAGWQRNKNGFRAKGKQTLSIKLFAQNTDEYTYITQKLQKQWQLVGVDLQVQLVPSADLQGTVNRHEYDALLYAVSIGPDPDVFAYWHSSQADPRSASRLNLSEYKSTVADKALEAGRTRVDPTIRTIKYRQFLDAWRVDAPALALYQPHVIYVTRGKIYNFSPTTVNIPTDRFANVNNWMINTAKLNQ